MSEIILKTEKISKNFGGVAAVKDFSMELSAGQIKGIIGPNGAGKTTIFNLISNIYKADGGEVFLGGKSTKGLKQEEVAKLGLARTFQNIRLFSGLSVLDNVKIALDHAGKYNIIQALLYTPKMRREEKRISEAAYHCLELVGLEEHAKSRPGSLPYGIQRRVEIARALAMEPKVLLLDEPAAGLNPEEVFELIDFIGEVKNRFSLSMLIIEHRMDVIMSLCEHIYVQDFGVTIATGTPEEIQTNPKVLEAYLGKGEEENGIS